MELEGVQDMDERMTLIRAEVQAEQAEAETAALQAATEAIRWDTVAGLVAMAAIAVSVVVALVIAA